MNYRRVLLLIDLEAGAGVTRSLQMIAEVRRRRALAVLWVANEAASGENIVYLARGERARRAAGRFLRDHATSAQRITAYVNVTPPDVASLLQVAGIAAHVELTTTLPSGPFDLAVTSHVPGALFAARIWRAPVLILPPLDIATPATERAMESTTLASTSFSVSAMWFDRLCARSTSGEVYPAEERRY